MSESAVRKCGFKELRKRKDGRFQCMRCGRVMPEHWYDMISLQLSRWELRKLDSRPALESNR